MDIQTIKRVAEEMHVCAHSFTTPNRKAVDVWAHDLFDAVSAAPTEAEGAKDAKSYAAIYELRPSYTAIERAVKDQPQTASDIWRLLDAMDAELNRLSTSRRWGLIDALKLAHSIDANLPIQQAPSGEVAEAVHQWRFSPDPIWSPDGEWRDGYFDRSLHDPDGRYAPVETRTLYTAPVVPARAQEATHEDYRAAVDELAELLIHKAQVTSRTGFNSYGDWAVNRAAELLAARTQGAK